MRSRYKIAELEAPHFITCTIVGWLPVFTRQKYLDVITASLCFCRQTKGLRLHAYVILDNHLHLMVSADNLSQVIRDFKRHTEPLAKVFFHRDCTNLSQGIWWHRLSSLC